MGSRKHHATVPRDLRGAAASGNSLTLACFASEQIRQRLTKLAQQAERSQHSQDEGAVHDLRVAIRRFSQGLILFEDLLPSAGIKRIRKPLKNLMKLSSEVRNVDIALEYLGDGAPKSLRDRLLKDRETHAAEYQSAVAEWKAANFASTWLHLLGFKNNELEATIDPR